MPSPQLGIDSEDLNLDILPAIERSFGIQFTAADFHEGFTYGELCELVRRKLPQQAANDCTSQQAFYKLRQALRPLTGSADIRPATRLANLLPRDPRPAAAHLNAALSMQLDLVTMPKWMETSGSVLLLGGLALLPVVVLAASIGGAAWGMPAVVGLLSCWGLSIALVALGTRIGKRLVHETVGEVARHMSGKHYRLSRRHAGTANFREVQALLDQLFISMGGLEPGELVPEAVL